ncbi:acetyltransferase [Pseudomonas viridiflava]|uniref:acetyltransferase n=1 Tax=Pseudomonas viridiflava TaxID=33069 RepID=UPI000F0255F7|nr:acetyltransferase [Pseudomonas viridiflava]
MNHKLNTYGVSIVERPKIKATKKLDLGGDQGKQIVYSETKLVLINHKNTFKKLADMYWH